jgi:tRNA-dihydrouridine synthase
MKQHDPRWRMSVAPMMDWTDEKRKGQSAQLLAGGPLGGVVTP